MLRLMLVLALMFMMLLLILSILMLLLVLILMTILLMGLREMELTLPNNLNNISLSCVLMNSSVSLMVKFLSLMQWQEEAFIK